MEMEFDFGSYVKHRKNSTTGERGEGYAYEDDLKVLRAMRKMPSVEHAVGQTVKLGKNFIKSKLLGTSVKVGPTQFARVHRIVAECSQTLGIPEPTVYVVPNLTSINAMTSGTDDDAFIVVHAATLDHLTDEELRFVLGHECGHIQNNHVVYLTTLTLLHLFAQNLAGVLFAPLLYPVTLALSTWSRAAEVSCDRAGLLCCKDLSVATNAFVKLAVGSKALFKEIDIEVYLDQFREGRESVGRVSELSQNHPYLPRRIEALRIFAGSELYRHSQGLTGGYDRAELEKRTAEVIQVL